MARHASLEQSAHSPAQFVRSRRVVQAVPSLWDNCYYHQSGGYSDINFPAHLIDRILHVTALHYEITSLEAAGPLRGHEWHLFQATS